MTDMLNGMSIGSKTRDYKSETENRVRWIRGVLEESGAGGIIFGSSGGKDSALAGILCKMAAENTLGVIMPCGSKVNYGSDADDASALAEQFGIRTITVDLTGARDVITGALGAGVSGMALNNIAPRLRMTALYAIGQSMGYLVAGTGNCSERYVGYFTKWGDGACDFNPIGDLTASEVIGFLKCLNAPRRIVEKAPSAGLFDGQTDEGEMGVTYAAIDGYIKSAGAADLSARDKSVIERMHRATAHKRRMPPVYGEDG